MWRGRARLLLATFLLLLLFLCGVQAQSSTLNAIWNTWKVQNKKNYSSKPEERTRMRIFESNYRFCQWHNRRYYLGLESYTTALNKFADLTIKEFADQYLNLRTRKVPTAFGKGRQNQYMDPRILASDSVDWRKHGYVTPVKDQV